MISLVLASLLSVGFSADLPVEKDVPVVEGKFAYHGNYQVFRKTEAYSIPSDEPESDEWLNKLIGQGYHCSTQSDDSYMCWKESKIDQRDQDEVNELVAERCKAESIDFRAVYDKTEGVHNSTFLRTFRVYQKVIRNSPEVDEQIISEMMYSWNSTGRWFVTFPTEQGTFTYDLVLPEAKSMTRFLTVEKTSAVDSKVKTKRSYQVQVQFSRDEKE